MSMSLDLEEKAALEARERRAAYLAQEMRKDTGLEERLKAMTVQLEAQRKAAIAPKEKMTNKQKKLLKKIKKK